MRFRPRYSLLTLLLLTAGIAVGIKLWRGPHIVPMSDPPTPLEASLIEQFPIKLPNCSITHDYEFLREWKEDRILSARGIPQDSRWVILKAWSESNYWYLVEEKEVPRLIREGAVDQTSQAKLVSWIYSPHPSDIPWRYGSKDENYHVQYAQATKECYFLAERKVVCRYIGTYLGFHTTMLVDPETIEDSYLRWRIQTEVKRIAP